MSGAVDAEEGAERSKDEVWVRVGLELKLHLHQKMNHKAIFPLFSVDY